MVLLRITQRTSEDPKIILKTSEDVIFEDF